MVRCKGGVKTSTSGKTSGNKQNLCHSLKNNPNQQTRLKTYLGRFWLWLDVPRSPQSVDPLQAAQELEEAPVPTYKAATCAAANQ